MTTAKLHATTRMPTHQARAIQMSVPTGCWANRSRIALTMDAVADIATMRGNYDDAEVALQQAILGWRVVGAAAVSGGLTVRLANVYALQGRTQQADAWFDEAIAAAERQRIVSFRNPTNAGLGGFYGLGVGRITNDD